jgi:hypothetical protein
MANFKEQKKYHFTYKTTNLINNRYYLGMHSTNRIDDGYLGSGKRLYYELNKYGRDNFKFEILKQFSSREELVQAEINLITEQDLKNPNCLNLSKGGQGGIHNEEHYIAFLKGKEQGSSKGGVTSQKKFRNNPEEVKRRALLQGKSLSKYYEDRPGTFKGKKHTPETISKMKESKQNQGSGKTNSQYGTCWITNEIENKKIHKGDTIPEGWRLGRKIKQMVL